MLISAHGTQIVSKLRPADHLRQLLMDNGGADNDVVKAFFEMHSEVQAAATALVLACSQSVQDAQIAEWATRSFFLFGGEPRLFYPGGMAPGMPSAADFARDELYKNMSSRKIDSWRLFSREYDFPKTFSLT